MRIGLTFNLKPPGATGDRYEEFDSEETIAALERAIRSSGHSPVRLGWGEELLDALDREPIDGVFNLAEGIGGRGRESQVPALLEMFGIPCSASSALSIGLTLDKALAKRVAQANGIATAPFIVVEAPGALAGPLIRPSATFSPTSSRGGEGRSISKIDIESPSPHASGEKVAEGRMRGRAHNDTLRFPLFCKPCNEGSSMGITAKSLCRDEAELQETVERLTRYGPVLVEEFLSGDEYTVGIVAGEPVGVMQVVSKHDEKDFIYSIDVKRDYLNLVDYRFFRDEAIESVALAVWRAFDLRDVARVDIRRDRDGVPNFVEVNPLPGMNPVTSDLIILAQGLGWEYDQLIGRVIGSAVARWSA